MIVYAPLIWVRQTDTKLEIESTSLLSLSLDFGLNLDSLADTGC